MKREWKVRTGFFKGLVGWWVALGSMASTTIGLIFRNHDRHGHDSGPAWVHSPIHWVLPIWLGPFVIAAVVLGVYGSALGLREMWRHPPVRRVTSPVLDDLRVVAKREMGSEET